MKKTQIMIYLLALVSAMLLNACAGGGDNTSSSNWDAMKWDQGQWK